MIVALDERSWLLVDGTDGRRWAVDLGGHGGPGDLAPGMILAVGGPASGSADRTVAALARDHGGVYDPERHRARLEAEPAREGRDPDAFVAAHVRRLEALRRAGLVARLEDGRWQMPDDLPERAAGLARTRPPRVEILSAVPLERLVRADGPGWLGRPYREPVPGERIAGVYRRAVTLGTGNRYALIDSGRDFTLLPWRTLLDRRVGEEVGAHLGAGGVSWTVGRGRGPSIA